MKPTGEKCRLEPNSCNELMCCHRSVGGNSYFLQRQLQSNFGKIMLNVLTEPADVLTDRTA